MPEGAPDLAGVVVAAERAAEEVRIVVDTSGDRTPDYVVAVDGATRLLRSEADGKVAKVSAEAISEGARVQVWHTGTVALSHPAQVRARSILLLQPGSR
jgi:hypothetical protein